MSLNTNLEDTTLSQTLTYLHTSDKYLLQKGIV